MASEWGHATTVLAPDRRAYNSAWSSSGTTLLESRDTFNSRWTPAETRVRNPHQPVAVLVGEALRHVPIRTLMPDGTLR